MDWYWWCKVILIHKLTARCLYRNFERHGGGNYQHWPRILSLETIHHDYRIKREITASTYQPYQMVYGCLWWIPQNCQISYGWPSTMICLIQRFKLNDSAGKAMLPMDLWLLHCRVQTLHGILPNMSVSLCVWSYWMVDWKLQEILSLTIKFNVYTRVIWCLVNMVIPVGGLNVWCDGNSWKCPLSWYWTTNDSSMILSMRYFTEQGGHPRAQKYITKIQERQICVRMHK